MVYVTHFVPIFIFLVKKTRQRSKDTGLLTVTKRQFASSGDGYKNPQEQDFDIFIRKRYGRYASKWRLK
jgi:hypothetical protein